MARTAFVTHDGLYEWVVLPQGLKTAPAIFSQLMSLVLAGLNWVICACFLDDIGVFARRLTSIWCTYGKCLSGCEMLSSSFR
jgi:hypothetical protein